MANIKEEQLFTNKKMILNGKGQVSVNPDLAILRLGVQTSGENVEAAQSENARISQQVVESLRQLGITDIKTFQYQIEKVYNYENGTRIDLGYTVRNIFEIRMSNMDLIGTAIDTAVYNGANIVDSVSFDVADPDIYYQQALTLAVKNAFQKAKTISSSLRIMFDPVPILITENTAVAIPFTPAYRLGEIAYTTPIEPGIKNIEANVTVEFIY
jgi:uncharacterized protein